MDDLVFSLTCQYCDAGTNVTSREQAEAEGWTEIEDDRGGWSWNYLGVCPDCLAEHIRDSLPPEPSPDGQ
jgi:hypothetical protein